MPGNKTARKCGKAIESVDMFGHSVELNIGGQGKIQSKIGACVTVFLSIVFFTYSVVRAQQLLFREDVDVATIQLIEVLDSSTQIDLKEINMTIAFGVQGYFDKQNKNDPNYVEWVVSIESKIGEEESQTMLDIHICNEDDYADFYPIVGSQETTLQQLKDTDALYCLDKGQNLTLFGNNDNTDYRRLDTKLMPCKPDVNNPARTCDHTLAEMIDYLGPVQLLVYYNAARFDQQIFSQKKIVYESKIMNQQFDNRLPNFFNGQILKTELEDESSWVSLGIPQMEEFYEPFFGVQKISAWDVYPSRYRITGFELLVDFDVQFIQRSSYDFLGWLGDVGGILQGLEWIGLILVATYYSPSNGNSYIVNQLFQQARKDFRQKKLLQMVKTCLVKKLCHVTNDDKLLKANIQMDLDLREDIPRWDFCAALFGCCTKQQRRNKMLIKKGLKRLDQELDILHIIRQLRVLKMSYKAMQTGANRKLIEGLSEKKLSSAQSDDESSSDQNGLDQSRISRKSLTKAMLDKDDIFKDVINDENFDYIGSCIEAKDIIGQNLINMWKEQDNQRIKRWQKDWEGIACDNALGGSLWDRHQKCSVQQEDYAQYEQAMILSSNQLYSQSSIPDEPVGEVKANKGDMSYLKEMISMKHWQFDEDQGTPYRFKESNRDSGSIDILASKSPNQPQQFLNGLSLQEQLNLKEEQQSFKQQVKYDNTSIALTRIDPFYYENLRKRIHDTNQKVRLESEKNTKLTDYSRI